MASPKMIPVRAVRGCVVPFEGDPKRYVGLARAREKDGAVAEADVMHRIPGVLVDGKKKSGPSTDVVFVAEAEPVLVPETTYYVRALTRGELALAKG